MDMRKELEQRNIMTFEELCKKKGWEKAVLVISQSSFKEEYTEEERSYVIDASSEWFTDKDQNNLYASCLKSLSEGVTDETNVLISFYISRAHNPWKIEYCYILS